ncbi:coiled-coil domain-containing protein 178-like [Branchiostoma lanceolatum]|uniref:coiled-coil domain-containing protein 178-like n=1 Tax=Branchiostoma lanceolatum TaxID=7740 RepID=UPI0034518690
MPDPNLERSLPGFEGAVAHPLPSSASDHDHDGEKSGFYEEKLLKFALEKIQGDGGRGDEPGGQVQEEENEYEEELADSVAPLDTFPQDWPYGFVKPFRRRSCALTNAVSPCINKATSHLHQLQDKIERWFQEKTIEIMSEYGDSVAGRITVEPPPIAGILSSGMDASPPAKSGTTQTKKQLRFAPPSASSSSSSIRALERRLLGASSSNETSTVGTLEVRGYGASMLDEEEEEPEEPIAVPELPYLGAEEVIDEVMALLGRLEADRLDTENKLVEEKQKGKRLQAKIDMLSHRRMVELPLSVQREHEACAMDISELHWHVNYKTRQNQRTLTKAQVAERLNTNVKEDIGFTQKHCPLVEEKLDLEMDSMARIRQAQHETDGELEQTMERLRKTEEKFQDSLDKANMERQAIEKGLNQVRQQLKQLLAEMNRAQAMNTAYTQKVFDTRKKIEDSQHNFQVLTEQLENSHAQEAMQGIKVKDFQKKIQEQEYEHSRLYEICHKCRTERNKMQEEFEEENSNLDIAVEQKLQYCREVQVRNRDAKVDIEEMMDKLNECERQKIVDEKSTGRIHKEMEKMKEQMSVIQEEFESVQAINNAIKDTVAKEQEKAKSIEDQLKTTADALKKQVKEEMHTSTILKARITSDTSDHDRLQLEAKKKQDKVTKKVDEIENAVSIVEEDIIKRRKTHADTRKVRVDLESQLSEVTQRHQKLDQERSKRKGELQPVEKKLKDEHAVMSQKLETMKKKLEMMKTKRNEMERSLVIMNKITVTTENAIAELQQELEELNIQIQDLQRTEDMLRSSLNEVTSRRSGLDGQHRKHMDERSSVLSQNQENLEDALQYNKKLAEEYRRLMDEKLNVKDTQLQEMDARVKMESSLKDLKELSGLQSRLHLALVQYFDLRGAYNQAGLARMEAVGQETGKRILVLQDGMNDAVQEITGFLKGQLDGSAAREVSEAAAKALREESHTPLPGVVREDTRTSAIKA